MAKTSEQDKQERVHRLMHEEGARFVRFKGAAYMSIPGVTRGMKPFNYDDFYRFAESVFPGMTDNKVKDFSKAVTALAEDWSEFSRYICFADQVWDTETLTFAPDQLEYVYSTNIRLQSPGSAGYKAAKKFLLELAAGDADLAHDYPQAMAPLFMRDRPSGVIWFTGDGANGKSSLLNTLYMGFGPYLVSLTTAAIEDGRDTPMLIGKMGNIVREASESRVEDTQRYKAIGTHESFTVHEFNKQGGLTIEADFHTIFNANNIPIFSDKTRGARRRTLPVPFPAHFADNPTFERDTFTPEFLGGLYMIILETAAEIRANDNKYRWSDATMALKSSYDSEVNSAEAFLQHMLELKIAGFTNYTELKWRYEKWCHDQGLVPLGTTLLKRTMTNEGGAVRRSLREEGKAVNRYFLASAPQDDNLVWVDGCYGMPGAKKTTITPPVNGKLSKDW